LHTSSLSTNLLSIRISKSQILGYRYETVLEDISLRPINW
jgi:hypothetical protein